MVPPAKGGADPATVVVFHMETHENARRASSSSAGLTPNSRRPQQAGLHSVLKMGRTRVLKKGVNAAMDIPVKDRLIINSIHIALEPTSLHWIEEEKELSM